MQSSSIDQPATHRWPIIVCCAATIIVALLPSIAPFLPIGYLETLPNPEVSLPPATSFGPAGLTILQLISIIVAGITITICQLSGARSIHWLNAIFGLATIVSIYQSTQSYDDAIVSGSWISAFTIAIAAIYLAQFAIARRMLIASLCALLIPYAIDSIYFIYIEHPFTVKQFYQNEETFLKQKGWELGSTQYQLFVRRMESPDALNVFSLANVFGSILASILMIAGAILLSQIKTIKKHPANPIIFSVILLAGLFTVYLTHSKGAIGIIPFGFGLIVLLAFASKYQKQKWLSKLLPILAIALIFMPIILVILRGLIGPPETAAGERSLLFRYQYWLAAWHIFTSTGLNHLLLGTGPAGFGWQYIIHKQPINPEDVISVHNVFIDYIAMLGIAGLLLVISTITAIYRAITMYMKNISDKTLADDDIQTTQNTQINLPVKATVYLGLAIAAALFGTLYAVTYKQLIAETAILWLISVIAFIAVFTLIVSHLKLEDSWSKIALLVAAVVVLAHNQVEMSFYQYSSISLVWLICGAAIGSTLLPHIKKKTKPVQPIATLALTLTLAIVVSTIILQPVNKYQDQLRVAELSFHRQNITAALEALDKAAAIEPTAPEANRFRLQVRGNIAATLAKRNNISQAKQFINVALKQAEQYVQTNAAGAKPYRYQANLYEIAAQYDLLPDAMQKALQSTQQIIERSPYNIEDRMSIADLYWKLGQFTKSKEQYEAALRISDQYYLDPGKQLTDKQRALIEKRLNTIKHPNTPITPAQ